MNKYKCKNCGYIYDEAKGIPEAGIKPGTKWEDITDKITCLSCGAEKEEFEMRKKLFYRRRKIIMIKYAIGALIGGLIGYFLIYKLIGCSTSSCAITANPYISTIYGALMGVLFAGAF